MSNAKDISRADKAVCNFAFISWEGQNESEHLQIHKGMMFDTLQELQFFMADYAVKFHRPFTVVHSDKNLRYDVMCKQGCLWRVWSQHVRSTGKWRVSRVVQPHTCSSSKPKQVHSQCTEKYLGRRILGIVRADSDTSVPSIVESIFAFSSYCVKYSKAWRAKQHAIALLWGDWKASYGMVPRVLSARAHYNPGIKWFPFSGGLMLPDNGVYKHVLQRVFWCFPQCAVAF